ncbi:MAG: sigma-70 family RNA polymerase sigma factor [Ruminococcus sp.]|nr:sigma-70 family RNA polymerase sigma factor [Ruminococcus sp.]
MLEDSSLIALYFERSQQAITETDLKYGKMCRTISVRIVGDRRDAEECVSDTYLKVWNTIPPERPNSFSAYISRIVRNLSLDCYRRKNAQKRQGEDLPFEELSECIAERPDDSQNEAVAEALNEFLSELPKEQRIYFMRRYYLGEPLSDIAERYGISSNTLGVTMHRLRKKFAKKLIESGIVSERRKD